MVMTESPVCIALLICESVIEDTRTRNKTIINTFNGITARKFPMRRHQMTVFISLSNGNGKVPLTLSFVKDEKDCDKVQFEFQVEATFNNPLEVLELGVDLRHVPFPEPGDYSIRLYADGELLTQRRFQAILLDVKGGS
jgi:hypothetical protein